MIKITSQDGIHQYDSKGRPITTWDSKKCNWMVNKPFEEEEIDWYGEDSDFPAGYTEKEFVESHPNWDKLPDISVTWTWNNKASCIAAFGLPHTFLKWSDPHISDYWDVQKYPYTCNRSWGYIECPEDEAVERFATYSKFHRNADNVEVRYNGKVLFSGKYKGQVKPIQ